MNERKTLTVGELIDALRKYQQDMPVFAQWEGIITPIDTDSFTLLGGGLFIDVNDY